MKTSTRWPRKKCERPTKLENETLPCHAPKVKVCKTMDIIRDSKDIRLAELWRAMMYIESPTIAEEVQLKTVGEVIAEVQYSTVDGLTCAVCDIKCAFFQHQIPEAFSQWLVCAFGTRKFRFVRLPMGATISPEVQQRIGEAVVKTCVQEEPKLDITWTVHIDNFRWAKMTKFTR